MNELKKQGTLRSDEEVSHGELGTIRLHRVHMSRRQQDPRVYMI